MADGRARPRDGRLVVLSADVRPDLWTESEAAFRDVWPEYNQHGDVAGEYFGALFPRYARFQFLVWDQDAERVVARGRTIPFTWNGTLDDLPAGIDALGVRAIAEGRAPTALSALAAEVMSNEQGRGISRLVITSMADIARAAGLHSLVAPVRPLWKDRYPLIPIDEYVTWVRDDGSAFDPWIGLHFRMGAEVLRCEHRSMQITGSTEEWTSWTGMQFPADGDYVFPGGLAPLEVRDGTGRYWEPNVWMLHRISE